MKTLVITGTELTRKEEKLIRPFGFKGGSLTELWQAVPLIRTEKHTAVCPSTQSVLWSDSAVFAEHSPDESNMLMYKVTARALELIKGRDFERPDGLLEAVLPELYDYADSICKRKVRKTFVLNSLVGVDFALWSLYAAENGIGSFDGIIPGFARETMSVRNEKLAQIPLISYNVDEAELVSLLESGAGILKIKIGKSVDRTTHETDMRTMVEWDIQRIAQIHKIASRYRTPLTKSGRVCYYLDANGRYDSAGRLWELVDGMEKCGALADTAVIEEPFPEDMMLDVREFPVIMNADESAHSEADLQNRISLGYRSVALKPAAKTLSVSFRMADAMRKAGGQYLCADLTVNPLLAEWNKQFAARLAPLSAMAVGCVEVNGDSNYADWTAQTALLPEKIPYRGSVGGCFVCDSDFYENSGALFGRNGYFGLFGI